MTFLMRQAVFCGWTGPLLALLIERLLDARLRQGFVLLDAVNPRGFVGRATILRAMGEPTGSKLSTWIIRKINDEIAAMKREGLLPDDACAPLTTIYDARPAGLGYQAAAGYQMPVELVALAMSGAPELLVAQTPGVRYFFSSSGPERRQSQVLKIRPARSLEWVAR